MPRASLDLMSESGGALSLHRPLSGRVRLGLVGGLCLRGPDGSARQFSAPHPEVELTIEIGMSGDLFRQLDEGRYDLVLRQTPAW